MHEGDVIAGADDRDALAFAHLVAFGNFQAIDACVNRQDAIDVADHDDLPGLGIQCLHLRGRSGRLLFPAQKNGIMPKARLEFCGGRHD